MKKLLTTLAVTGAIGAGLLGGSYVAAKKTNLFDGHQNVQLMDSTVKMPEYNRFKLAPGSCSGYVRRAAEDIFDKEYSFANAWDRKYSDTSVAKVKDNDELKQLYADGKLEEGMIVGAYYPESTHNDDIDIQGNKVNYTHTLLFLGENPQGELTFAEQFGKKFRTRTLEQFAQHGLEAREVLDSKN